MLRMAFLLPSARDQCRMVKKGICVYLPNHPCEFSGQAALRAPLLKPKEGNSLRQFLLLNNFAFSAKPWWTLRFVFKLLKQLNINMLYNKVSNWGYIFAGL